MYLVLLETSGNQNYIFSTNKLRENVGASELTYQIGTKIVMEAIGKYDVVEKDFDGNKLREFLFNTAQNPFTDKDGHQIEVIIATSGKALLLVNDFDKAKSIVSLVTKKALKTMPGLTVHGAISSKITDKTAKSLHEAVREVHIKLETIRYQILSNLQRFQRIPFVAECQTSNLPAKELYKHPSLPKEEKKEPHSLVSITKQTVMKEGKDRLEKTIRDIKPEIFKFDEQEEDGNFAKNPHRLDVEERFRKTKWFAVIHADGNGLGQLFLDFQKETGTEKAGDYIDKYRKFSLELDNACVNAVAYALENLQKKYFENQPEKSNSKNKLAVPAIPLVLGGDDLTIICDGEYAIKFAKDFLTEFVEETKRITDIFKEEKKLGICAGIAIIKPHFPFHQAYDLAEQLLQSAKKTKQISPSLSAFDYHVLYDSSGTTLEEIREKTPFVARPYVVTPHEGALKTTNDESKKEWIKNHHFNELELRVKAMTDKDDDQNKLPNSQLHILREGLFVADKTLEIQKEVDARAKLIAHRYETFKDLFVKDKTLFFDESGEKLTHFLDALDIVEFWK